MAHKSKIIRSTRSDQLFNFFVYAVVGILTFIVLYPLIYILSSSFSSPQAVSTGKVFLWPVDFSLQGYTQVFSDNEVWRSYRTTICYTIFGTCINVFTTLICAYPLSRKDLPHKLFFTTLFTFTMMFSGGLIPTYLIIRDLHMLNSIWAMVIPGAMSAYQMIVTRTFFQSTLPQELIEATQVDGCDDFRFFAKFVLPLSKAIIAVIAMQYAIGHWNSYFNAFIYLSNENYYPLQIYLRKILLLSQIAASETMDADMAAAIQGLSDLLKYSLIVVATVPILCVYPFIQKYFIQGVMIGSLKG